MSRLSAWQSSLLLHSFLLALAALVVLRPARQIELIDVPIYQQPVPDNVQILKPDTATPVVLKSVNLNPETDRPARAIFGASRNAHTSGEGIVEAKRGNTVAKAVDDTILKDTDADALPTPTDEFLVSQMPVVLAEVKPVYPPQAREARLEGAVVVDALIDAAGLVRQALVLEGADIFRAPALVAIKQFRFRPALVEGRPVAVRIRYTLRFRLEI
jgi:protein TonB